MHAGQRSAHKCKAPSRVMDLQIESAICNLELYIYISEKKGDGEEEEEEEKVGEGGNGLIMYV